MHAPQHRKHEAESGVARRQLGRIARAPRMSAPTHRGRSRAPGCVHTESSKDTGETTLVVYKSYTLTPGPTDIVSRWHGWGCGVKKNEEIQSLQNNLNLASSTSTSISTSFPWLTPCSGTFLGFMLLLFRRARCFSRLFIILIASFLIFDA